MTTILSANGLIELPEEFRKADSLKPGQRCEIERVGHGEYRVRVEEGAAASSGNIASAPDLVDWLLACPEKGWFTPMERGETTDDLKPLSFE